MNCPYSVSPTLSTINIKSTPEIPNAFQLQLNFPKVVVSKKVIFCSSIHTWHLPTQLRLHYLVPIIGGSTFYRLTQDKNREGIFYFIFKEKNIYIFSPSQKIFQLTDKYFLNQIKKLIMVLGWKCFNTVQTFYALKVSFAYF